MAYLVERDPLGSRKVTRVERVLVVVVEQVNRLFAGLLLSYALGYFVHRERAEVFCLDGVRVGVVVVAPDAQRGEA